MKTLLKIIVLLGGAGVSLLILLSIADPTFGTYLGEQIGFAAGSGFVVLMAMSPIFVFGFLLWLLFFRKKK